MDDALLATEIARYYSDPLGFVLAAFDWDSVELSKFVGPDTWATDVLSEIGRQVKANDFDGLKPVSPIRIAVSSGHGIGKTALTAWLILWIMSTRPNARGIVTATTYSQLESKTWAELGKWRRLCITGHWFEQNSSKQSMRLRHRDNPDSWRCDAQSCDKSNSESFAGLHAADSTPFYIFDESSGVPDEIFEVAEGGLTDGEPMFFVFGNPTKNTGKFSQIFTKERAYWYTQRVDSRKARITNKELFKDWEDLYGDDSDFFRVRVKGEFPRAASTQFIPSDLIEDAQKRNLELKSFSWDTRIMSIDIARFGDDSTVFTYRQGRKLLYQQSYHEMELMKIASLIAYEAKNFSADAIFIDGAGVGGGVVDRCIQLQLNVIEVNGGSKADNQKEFFNKRAEMYQRLKDWLKTADIPAKCEQLADDLTCIEYGFSNKLQMALERKEDVKKRLKASPDYSDSLALSFAYNLASHQFHDDPYDAYTRISEVQIGRSEISGY